MFCSSSVSSSTREEDSLNYGKRSRQELTNNYYSDDGTNFKKTKMYNGHTIIILDDNLNNINCNVFKLLKNKFTTQQLGKKLWLENREVKHDFIPIEFSKDKNFIMDFSKRMTNHNDYWVKSPYIKYCQYECWEQIGDELKNDIDMILTYSVRNIKHLPASLTSIIDKYCNDDERMGMKFLVHLFNTIVDYHQIYSVKNKFTFTKKIATNQELLLEFIKLDDKIFEFADYNLKNDRNFVLNSVSANTDVFYLLHSKYFDDKEVVLRTIGSWRGGNDSLFREKVSNRLKKDRDIILACGKKDIDFLKYADAGYENDREFALKMVQCYGKSLEYFSDNIKNDREVVLAAVKNGGHVPYTSSEEFLLDREIVIESVKYSGLRIIFSKTYQKDREIALMAVKRNGKALQYVSPQLSKDREIVLEAVKENGMALKYADESFTNDREIVLESVRSRIVALQFASDELQNDLDILLEAVEKHGGEVLECLCSMSTETALKLVKQDGLLLEYLPDDFKSDNEIVKEAINQNPISILFSDVDDDENLENISKVIEMMNSKYPTNLLKEEYLRKITDIELAYKLVKYNPLAIHYLNVEINEKIGFKATLLENGHWMEFSEDYFQERIIHEYHAAKIDANNEINYYRNRNNKLWTNEIYWRKWF